MTQTQTHKIIELFSYIDTSRVPNEGEVSGRGYNFIEKEQMSADISAGQYFEWGEHDGDFYGSKLNAIRDIVNAGKTCVVDCDASVSLTFQDFKSDNFNLGTLISR